MFFRRDKNVKFVEPAPLAYWEENSYMMAVPKEGSANPFDGIFDRVEAIEGLTLKEKALPSEQGAGKLVFDYDGEEYTVGFYPGEFQWSDILNRQSYYFTEEEIEGMKRADQALTVFMKFHEDCKKSFHLQIKLIIAMMPELLGIVDESAEKLISAKWAKMAAASLVTPAPSAMYTVQAISDEGGEVWLHTHGLCRCGLTELEVLQSDVENYNNHYHMLSTFASRLMDKNEPFMPRRSSFYIGMLENGDPIVVTCVPWQEAIGEYKKLAMGGMSDRQDGHNSQTSPIFLYTSEQDETEGKLTKVSELDQDWGDNPLFFISNEETDRMRRLARERFDFVREYGEKEGNQVLIKIGLVRDDSEEGSTEREHIWFELLGFEGESFRARLTQEPYAVASMHEGDEAVFTIKDVTDWILYTPEFPVSPDNVYLLV